MSTRPAWWRYLVVPILALIVGWFILAGVVSVYVRLAGPIARTEAAKLYDLVGTRLLWPLSYLVYLAFLCRGSLAEKRERLALERAAAGLCPRCGYDLRAGHERCPECGRPTAGFTTAEPSVPNDESPAPP